MGLPEIPKQNDHCRSEAGLASGNSQLCDNASICFRRTKYLVWHLDQSPDSALLPRHYHEPGGFKPSTGFGATNQPARGAADRCTVQYTVEANCLSRGRQTYIACHVECHSDAAVQHGIRQCENVWGDPL